MASQVDLAQIFDRKILPIKFAQRKSLTNAHSQTELLRRRQRARSWHKSGEPHAWRALRFNYSTNTTMTLGPMEIHTFELELRQGEFGT